MGRHGPARPAARARLPPGNPPPSSPSEAAPSEFACMGTTAPPRRPRRPVGTPSNLMPSHCNQTRGQAHVVARRGVVRACSTQVLQQRECLLVAHRAVPLQLPADAPWGAHFSPQVPSARPLSNALIRHAIGYMQHPKPAHKCKAAQQGRSMPLGLSSVAQLIARLDHSPRPGKIH